MAGLKKLGAALCLFSALLSAQSQPSPELKSILDRLDRLEQENRSLSEQVKELRSELAAARGEAAPAAAPAAAQPSTEERLDVQQRQIEEQAQTKVEASQKFPIRLTGMALFNTFLDSRQNGGAAYPTVAAPGTELAGATLRQTIVGLEFSGPRTFLGGTVRGSVYMDFSSGSAPLAQTMRLRTGSIELDWKSRSILVGVEKPIFNPREPDSLAQVAISPLTGAGNLWLWIPQVRLEQDLKFGPARRSAGPHGRGGNARSGSVRHYAGCLPAWRRCVRASRAAMSFTTTWTATAVSRSLPASTPAPRTPAASLSHRTCFPWTGFSSPGGWRNSREHFSTARTSPISEPARSTRAM